MLKSARHLSGVAAARCADQAAIRRPWRPDPLKRTEGDSG